MMKQLRLLDGSRTAGKPPNDERRSSDRLFSNSSISHLVTKMSESGEKHKSVFLSNVRNSKTFSLFYKCSHLMSWNQEGVDVSQQLHFLLIQNLKKLMIKNNRTATFRFIFCLPTHQ